MALPFKPLVPFPPVSMQKFVRNLVGPAVGDYVVTRFGDAL